MKAMVLSKQGSPLTLEELPCPSPSPGQILIRVKACAVCRTDLHVVDGDLKSPKLPLIPGHEVIGEVEALGEGVTHFRTGDRVGVPWLGHTCGTCTYCKNGQENLCDQAKFTGYTLDGGFADHMVADARYCFPIPDAYDDVAAAPLMCAGLVGYRAFRMVGEAEHIGLYGFGAAAHIITQVAVHMGRKVYAFTKEGDTHAQAFARSLGATWAGSSNEAPPHKLDAAILFAPVGALVPEALKHTDKGGTVVCAGIHMSDIPTIPYKNLWEERGIRSVANLTREDGEQFLKIAPTVPVKTSTHTYALKDANKALDDLRHGRFEGAAVLVMDS
ncbi:zinc-dependent alcohol dehydrogenase family protein [Kordiimonas lipolytica]|uniref:alcohol dehydrogenase n=1 Tax=Kordiimonas lipolytica TaxID=1662421 RepID=A0ABV8UA79_9PROT|nr:zinc-dependent alcohol dehydrogenase family protein [Kordiimonas lipolytica]